MLDSTDEARITLSALKASLEQQVDHADVEIFNIIGALQQLFDIAEAVDQQNQIFTADEITDIGEQGLALIDDLLSKLVSLQLEPEKQEVEQLALVIGRWVIAHRGTLTNIQSIVNGLAYLSNSIQDMAALSQLATFMGQVVHACSDVIQHDLDNTNPMRPWRILNINRGIVTTRSHDLDLMRSVFPELIQAIPMDAPEFFKEGMSEMVRLDYPGPVCELMQEFCDRTQSPAVH